MTSEQTLDKLRCQRERQLLKQLINYTRQLAERCRYMAHKKAFRAELRGYRSELKELDKTLAKMKGKR